MQNEVAYICPNSLIFMEKSSCFLLFILLCTLQEVQSQSSNVSVQLQITNVRNGKGTLRLGLFKNEEDFENEKPFKHIIVSKQNFNKNSIVATVVLPQGSYGISILDDENDNLKMDYNIIKMPKEGFGFCNYYHEGFSRPKFKQFLITISNSTKILNSKIRYI
ncbi:MAG: DUF2141 domain-containing protein [Chitinophagaceae bacterium]|nr:DUF2141 domain-containing protein [Chitinophagaceae bacterium]